MGRRFITLAALAALVLLQVTSACYSPADPYAVEVVLNKPGVSYDLSRLRGAAEVEYAGARAYAYRSHYDGRLVVLLSEQELLGGRYLSVRLQVPVREAAAVYVCRVPVARCSREVEIGRVLEVGAGSGSATLDLGVVTLPTAFYVFRLVLAYRVEGNASLVVGGELRLEGDARSYRVGMPCLISHGTSCARVMVLIPGFDVPLRVEEGAYRASLTLSWTSTGRATIIVERLRAICWWEVLPQPLPRGWSLRQDGVLVGSVDGVQVFVNLVEGTCRVVVPGGGAPPPEAVSELERLLGGARVSLEYAGAEGGVRPAVEVSEGEVRAALRGELEWLVKSGVVRGLSGEDIASIAAAARLGSAGWSGRLVFYSGSWVPYSSVPGAAQARCAAGVPEVFRSESPALRQLGQAEAAPQPKPPSEPPGGPLGALAVSAAVALGVAALVRAAVRRAIAR